MDKWTIRDDEKLELVMKHWVESNCAPLSWDFFMRLLDDFFDYEERDRVKEWLEEERLRYEKN